MLKLKNICKIYKNKKIEIKALDNVSLSFGPDGLIFIVGKSGSGKSTLLNVIGGLDCYDSGEITINNIDISKFKNIDYDNYRSNCIGFIFQEFNLLEDYSVYENIILPLKLKNKNIEKNKIEKLLESLEIKELKNRKPNELSGGQKQRVAIARALIKKPKIILADEPTGNLDSETGTEVMKLLKKISKDTLVIVVTHDMGFANKYGDRIIEIGDGKIINDSKNQTENKLNHKEYKFIKSHLPINDIIKLGIKSLKFKKMRLVFSILLLLFSSIFLATMYKIETYNVDQNHLKLIDQNNLDFIEIKKYTYSQPLPGNSRYNKLKMETKMNDNDASFILNKVNGYKIYKFNEYSDFINLFKINIYIQTDLFNGKPEEEKPAYIIYSQKPQIVETNEPMNNKIIGNIPSKNNEILISNYIADLILQYGIKLYNSEEIYYPKDYNDILNKNYYFGNSSAKITGIIDYNLDKYQELKKIYLSDPNIDYNLYFELNSKVENIYNKIYAHEGFIDYLKENQVKKLDTNNNIFSMKLRDDLDIASYANINILEGEVSYFDGEKIVTKNSLSNNEMLIDLSNFINDFDDYEEKLNNYFSSNKNRDKLDLEIEYLLKNYNFSNIINSKYDLKVYHNCSLLYETFDKEYSNIYKDIKIIGITGLVSLKNNGIYFSKELLNDYIDYNIELKGIITFEKDFNRTIKLFPYNEKYATFSMYSADIERYNSNLLNYKDIIRVVTFILVLFSISLIFNFILNSISSRKKDIGILKSIGVCNFDIIKIFIIEGIILVIVTTILSILGIKFGFDILNKGIIANSDFIVAPFIFDIKTVLIVNLYNLSITIIISLVSLFKIAKMKPIDVINNK